MLSLSRVFLVSCVVSRRLSLSRRIFLSFLLTAGAQLSLPSKAACQEDK